MTYGEKITKLRKEKGLTQAELGEKLHVTFQAVSKWERGSSTPDFETVCLLAKFFDVPLSYFDSSADESESTASERVTGESADAAKNQEEAKPEIIGMCTKCGAVIREGEADGGPPLVCRACRKKEAEQKRRAAEIARHKEEERVTGLKKTRNRGLILGGIITALILIVGIVGMIGNGTSAGEIIPSVLVSGIFLYAFFSQIFWGGKVTDVAFAGGRLVGSPGVIFEFDLDGFIFLIAMKILFAIIRLLIYLITLVATVIAAVIISPFTFLPQLLKLNRGEDLDD